MKTLQGATALAAAALLALTLAGCSTDAPTSTDTGSDSSDTTEESTETETGGFEGVTLPGTGDYIVPDEAPIGGYELPEYQDGLPDGCTYRSFDKNGNVLGDSEINGQFVFLTDVTVQFVTDGCPDWVQFE